MAVSGRAVDRNHFDAFLERLSRRSKKPRSDPTRWLIVGAVRGSFADRWYVGCIYSLAACITHGHRSLWHISIYSLTDRSLPVSFDGWYICSVLLPSWTCIASNIATVPDRYPSCFFGKNYGLRCRRALLTRPTTRSSASAMESVAPCTCPLLASTTFPVGQTAGVRKPRALRWRDIQAHKRFEVATSFNGMFDVAP